MRWFCAIALIVCLACAGCGTAGFNHEIVLIVDELLDDVPREDLGVAIGPSYNTKRSEFGIPGHFPGTDGSIRIETGVRGATIWFWQQRPGSFNFNLYIPAISPNGFYRFAFHEKSKLPWRGLKSGAVSFNVDYRDFATWHKTSVPIVLPPADISPLPKDGFRFVIRLPITIAPALSSQK